MDKICTVTVYEAVASQWLLSWLFNGDCPVTGVCHNVITDNAPNTDIATATPQIEQRVLH
jgi:hypothetical protein